MFFQFRLEPANGEPAAPPTVTAAVPNWRPGDRACVSPNVVYRVAEAREGVLVVERE
jgi:hypothetical protein